MNVKWNDGEFFKKLEDGATQRLERAAIHLENEIKKKISDKSPPVSQPGEPPHVGERRGGELRRSITHEIKRGIFPVARIGSNKLYARMLEKGTSIMDARPFLEETLEEQKDQLARLIAGKPIV
jgi:HK97 gp10 family phage protein